MDWATEEVIFSTELIFEVAELCWPKPFWIIDIQHESWNRIIFHNFDIHDLKELAFVIERSPVHCFFDQFVYFFLIKLLGAALLSFLYFFEHAPNIFLSDAIVRGEKCAAV